MDGKTFTSYYFYFIYLLYFSYGLEDVVFPACVVYLVFKIKVFKVLTLWPN